MANYLEYRIATNRAFVETVLKAMRNHVVMMKPTSAYTKRQLVSDLFWIEQNHYRGECLQDLGVVWPEGLLRGDIGFYLDRELDQTYRDRDHVVENFCVLEAIDKSISKLGLLFPQR